jgi:isoquinoline 1-oxidoreductase subunit beta
MTTENKEKKPFSRRKFLQRGAIVMGGTLVASYFGCSPMRRFAAKTAEGLDAPAVISSFKPDFWFEVLADNTILMKSPKIEMGQGIFTGFAMIAAEELDMTLDQIKVEHASTKTGSTDSLGTGGSNSTLSLYKPIREVAATMREMLKEAAAKKWGAKASEIITEKGTLTYGKNTATYAEIAQSTKEWKVPKTPPLRDASTFKYIGKDVKRVDLKAKVMGTAEYTMDASFPGMLHALTLDSPYFDGKIKTIDTSAAAKVDGVVKIIQEKDLIAVVAKNRFSAEKALNAIEVTWDVPKMWQQSDIESIVTVGNGKEVNVQKDGHAKSLIEKNQATVFRQEYRIPIAAHAQMEVFGAVASVENDKATVIIGSQNPEFVRGQVAKDLDLKKDNVEIKTPFLGGGFGRRTPKNKASQAALISKMLGKPIKLIPTREQEFYNDMFRPNTHHVLQAVVDTDGNIEAISHDQATPDEFVQFVAGKVGLKFLGADWISAGHGAGIMYNIENKSASVWNVEVPYPVSIWRGVGMIPNTFAIESFMNELAHKTKKDPIEMRIALCKGKEEINDRYVKILEAARDKSGWATPKATGIGRGMAIANDRKGIAVSVVEVAIVEENIVVKKITQLLDCGKAINPEGIRMQMEGCAMMGISNALFEEVLVKDGKMEVSNFHEYPLPKLADTPDIQTIILENAPEPYGVGEPPLAPIAPAIAAAIFDLTGKNLRNLPLKLS